MSETIQLSKLLPPHFQLRDDLGDLEGLKADIKEHGLYHALTVRKKDGKYEIIMGHRRYMCAIELGWTEIDCKVVQVDDETAFIMAFGENFRRKDMDPIEEARAFRAYMTDYGFGGITDLAKKLGVSTQSINNRLSLLKTTDTIQEAVREERIGSTTAGMLTSLTSDQANEVFKHIETEKLDNDDVKNMVGWVKAGVGVDEAAGWVTRYPDLKPPQEGTKIDLQEQRREAIQLALQSCHKHLADIIEPMPENAEKKDWVKVDRDVHELINVSIRIRKGAKKVA